MTNQTFEQLKKTYESGRTRPLAWRRAQLNALRRLVTENRDAFVSSAMADLGKPAAETVLMELNLVAGEAQFVRDRERKHMRLHDVRPASQSDALDVAAGCRMDDCRAQRRGAHHFTVELSGAAGLGTNG